MIRVIRAKHAGFCFGVRRAAQLASDLVNSKKSPIHTIGPLIHNPQEVARLATMGIVSRERIEECLGGVTLVRTHGIGAEDVERARSLGIELQDATCPHVLLPRSHIERFGREGKTVLLLGDEGHPEVKALVSYKNGPVYVVRTAGDLPALLPNTPVALVAQTTQSEEAFAQVLLAAQARYGQVVVENTICKDTRRRQEEGQQLARQVDMMVVVGGKNSANTCRLAALCRAILPNTHHVEVDEELHSVNFEGAQIIGLTSGASTPDWIIDQVENSLKFLLTRG